MSEKLENHFWFGFDFWNCITFFLPLTRVQIWSIHNMTYIPLDAIIEQLVKEQDVRKFFTQVYVSYNLLGSTRIMKETKYSLTVGWKNCLYQVDLNKNFLGYLLRPENGGFSCRRGNNLGQEVIFSTHLKIPPEKKLWNKNSLKTQSGTVLVLSKKSPSGEWIFRLPSLQLQKENKGNILADEFFPF